MSSQDNATQRGKKRNADVLESDGVDHDSTSPVKRAHSVSSATTSGAAAAAARAIGAGGATTHIVSAHSLEDVLTHRAKTRRGIMRRVVQLQHDMTVAQALAVLAKEKIQAAPVVFGPSPLEDSDDGAYMGLVDVMTLLHEFVGELQRQQEGEAGQTVDLEDEQHVQKAAEHFVQRKLVTVCSQNDISFVFHQFKDTTIRTLLEKAMFKNPSQPVHRVALLNDIGRVAHLLTLTDLVLYVSTHLRELGSLSSATIEELELAKDMNVVKVTASTSALRAFCTMEKAGVRGLAIVSDDEGELVGNLSPSDLRGFTADQFPKLLRPVSEWVASQGGAFACRPHHTLEQLLKLIAIHRVHNVYVIDKHDRPIAVIALSDILARLTSADQ